MEWIQKIAGFRGVGAMLLLLSTKTGRTVEFFCLKKFNSSPVFFWRHYSSDRFCHRLVW